MKQGKAFVSIIITIKKNYQVLVYVLCLVVLFSCANPVAPTGGPRDTDPPEVLKSEPPNFSTDFQGGQVRIFFDEFVQLDNLNQKLLVSPPLEEMPQIRLRGKSIIMELEEPLRENSTYNFQFGDAIKDITEGNPLSNFQYVVSTGSYVDSLSVQGYIRDAFTLEAAPGIYVMLYDETYDSIPYLERPVYFSITDSSGYYSVNNMREGKFKLFALQDLNSNFLYDLPNERIAFTDSLVEPAYLGLPDFSGQAGAEEGKDLDTLLQTTDTIPQDINFIGINEPDTIKPDIISSAYFPLLLFQEKDTVQRILSSSLIRQGLIQVVFRIPADSAWVNELKRPDDAPAIIQEVSEKKDTINLWFIDPGRDSLFLEVGDGNLILDTIPISTVARRERRGDNRDAETAILNLSANASQSQPLPFFEPLKIVAENPVKQWDLSKIIIYENDSLPIEPEIDITGEADRIIRFRNDFKQGINYSLKVLPQAFSDIFGLYNDSLEFRFNTTAQEDYSTLIVNMVVPQSDHQYVMQLLTNDSIIYREKVVEQSGTFFFDYLRPEPFGLKLIQDRNSNGVWDTGNYLQDRQPERVYIFRNSIQLRENWETEISWEIE